MSGEIAPPTRVERFLAHLDQLSGGIEPRFLPVPSTHDGLKDLTVIEYVNLPEPGFLTAITYGLSLATQPEWRLGKPELILSVRSHDEMWARAMGYIAEQMRLTCRFSYGDTIGFGARPSQESEMTAFVVFAPAAIDRPNALGIEVGDDLPINLTGFYPIHQSEREFITANGLEAFWKLHWDMYDVTRPPAI